MYLREIKITAINNDEDDDDDNNNDSDNTIAGNGDDGSDVP